MRLAPFLKQTLVSPFSKDEVLIKIRDKTQLIHSDTLSENSIFNGAVSENHFTISLKINYSQNALPLVIGVVEDTSRGSVIFLKIKLFPAAALYIYTFSVLSVFIGMVFLTLSNYPIGSFVSFFIALANYLILNINFHRTAGETMKTLREILSPGH